MAKQLEKAKKQFPNVFAFQPVIKRCEGCGQPANYIVHGQPHCQKHMLEALCGVDTVVRTIDGDYDDAS